MGILSGFSIAVASVVTERIVNAQGDGFLHRMWISERAHVIAGAATALLAGYFFYLQRSQLAWLYGQIALAQARDLPSSKHANGVDDWLIEADGWASWQRYQAGFVALMFSVACYAYAILGSMNTSVREVSPWWSLWLPFIITALIVALRWRLFYTYSQTDNPYAACWQAIHDRRNEPLEKTRP